MESGDDLVIEEGRSLAELKTKKESQMAEVKPKTDRKKAAKRGKEKTEKTEAAAANVLVADENKSNKRVLWTPEQVYIYIYFSCI